MKKGIVEYKSVLKKIEDVTNKGTVAFYASVFGNVDRNNQIVENGAFKKV